MITLAPYGFYWFQLQERDKSEPAPPTGRARIRNPGGAAGLDLGVAGAHPRRVRARRAAGPSGANPLVSGAIGQGDPADAGLGDSVLRHRRQPAVARLLRDHAARRHQRAMCCRCRSNGCASTASATIRARWPPSGRARAKERCSTSPPTRSSSRCCCAICGSRSTVEEEEQGLRLEFRPTSRFSDQPIRQPERIRAVETEQSNSTALVDDDYVVKIYRKLEAGINPEIEMGRFLTDVAGFANTPALLGSVELVEGDSSSAIGVVHAFVANQGDAWTVTAAYLDRFVDEQRLLAASEQPERQARSRSPTCATCRRPDGASPKCTSRSPATRIFPISRRSRPGPRTCSAGSTTSWRAPNACSTR